MYACKEKLIICNEIQAHSMLKLIKMSVFSITTDSKKVRYLKEKDWKLGRVINSIGDIDCNLHDDPVEFIACEILGQMLSNKVAKVLRNRLEILCNGKITAQKISVLTHEDLRHIGLSNSKSGYLLNFAEIVNRGEIDFKNLESESDEVVLKKLTAIKGIGSWTAKMYLLFVLCRDDVLPYEDGAFLQAYKWLYNTEKIKKKDIIERCAVWHPYSSIASRFLYRALDTGLTKTDINRFLS